MSETQPMNVLQIAFSLAARQGGPARSISGLCRHLGRLGCDVHLAMLDFTREIGPEVDLEGDPVTRHAIEAGCVPARRLLTPRAYTRMVHRLAQEADVIHSHGLWETVHVQAAAASRRRGVPYVISVRGMLDPPSFGRKGWKKKLAMAGYARRVLTTATCLHATAPMEAEHFRLYDLRQPIAVIPNGVDVELYVQAEPDAARRAVQEKYPALSGRNYALFLGRLHEQKGTLLLADAWVELARRYPDWSLVLAGPDQQNQQPRLQQQMDDAGAGDRIVFTGEVDGTDKTDLYAGADLFVLPSYSENFGIVVAEALAAATPAITTTGTPWTALTEHNCGWRVEPTRDAVAQAMDQAMATSDSQRAAMGIRGREFVQRELAWPSVAGKMIELYRWMQGRGERPGFVQTV